MVRMVSLGLTARRLWWLATVICVASVVALFKVGPVASTFTSSAIEEECSNRIRGLALGIHEYSDSRKSLPPVHMLDAHGVPIQSWRILILPSMCSPVHCDFSKSWDDAANERISSSDGYGFFACPNEKAGSPECDYFAITGPNTAWPLKGLPSSSDLIFNQHQTRWGPTVPAGSRKVEEVANHCGRTILLIEVHGRNIQWAQPSDLSFDEAVELLATPPTEANAHRIATMPFSKPIFGRHVAFVDSHVEFLTAPISAKAAAALLSIEGGDDEDMAELMRATQQ